METDLVILIIGKNLSSYPTYEEWKQSQLCLELFHYQGSYPTYEEWKLDFPYNDEFDDFG